MRLMNKFDLRLKPETIDLIKSEAEKESRSVSGMARKILEDYFQKKDKAEKQLESSEIRVDKILNMFKENQNNEKRII